MHARVLQQQQYSIIKQHHVLSPKPLKARHTVLRRGEQTSAAASTPTLPSSRKIVLCISDSDAAGSRRALEYTLNHIYRQGDVLHVVHARVSSGLLAPQGQCLAFTMPEEEGLEDQMAETARQYFEAQGGFLTVAKEMGANVKLDLIHGRCSRSVTNTIVQRVQDLAAELVVLTVQRKRSFIQDLFQASPVSSLPEVCPCPTLIIPAACS